MNASVRIPAEFPSYATKLFRPAPYKVLYGGRGGSKSWTFADLALVLGARKRLFIVCGREIQRSIKESVHKLLSDRINDLGLSWFYEIKESEIVGRNSSRIVFVGVRNNISAIKSMEAIDVFWATEATRFSRTSWEVLLPTIRRDAPHGPFDQGSELWVDFNPELSSDYTYQYWVGDPPSDTIVIQVNWRDNPWFPDILRKQMVKMKLSDPDGYLTVWEGQTRKALAGAIYAKELQAAVMQGRISPAIKHVVGRGVTVAFDLGESDMTSMWFFQQIGMEHHAIDYYGNCGFGMDHYLEQIQARRYIIKQIMLPHDASNRHQVATRRGVAMTIEKQVREAYPGDGKVKVVPRIINVVNGINLVRMLFDRLYINDVTCADGLLALQHYQYEVDPDTGARGRQPKHDWASHPADGLRTYAEGLREGRGPTVEDEREAIVREIEHPRGLGWMGR
jgi:phage terminase large subunit